MGSVERTLWETENREFITIPSSVDTRYVIEAYFKANTDGIHGKIERSGNYDPLKWYSGFAGNGDGEEYPFTVTRMKENGYKKVQVICNDPAGIQDKIKGVLQNSAATV